MAECWRSVAAELRHQYAQKQIGAGKPTPTNFASTAAKELVALALEALAQQLPVTPHSFRLFTRLALRGLLVVPAHLHFAENTLALHLLLQRAQGLVDIVVTDEDLHGGLSSYL
jgi:hypothetical protein